LTTNRDDCEFSALAALPIMFPFLRCQARADANLPMLAADDEAWVSMLYRETADDAEQGKVPFSRVYGIISGTVLFADGESHFQGLNVLARNTESRARTFSVVSGYLFTGNPGQLVSGNNRGDRGFGSRNPLLIGKYDIPVRVGTYDLEVEGIFPGFFGGSSVGPLFPILLSSSVHPPQGIQVGAGEHVTDLDIALENHQKRFDIFEGK
jgi:hypothetical protein